MGKRAKKIEDAVKKDAKEVEKKVRHPRQKKSEPEATPIVHATTLPDHPASQNPGGIPVTNSNDEPVAPPESK